ncbi:MAG: hypothetical protein JRC69_11735 [Deltaproteobacteria bacterium]|nr:hypothetical protein [Deltaproteobacteria bacterium]
MINKRKYGRFELAEDVMFADQLTHPYCYFGGSTINYSDQLQYEWHMSCQPL